MKHFILCMSILLLFCTKGFSQKSQGKLIIEERVDFLDNLAREPMFAEHPNGDLYVTGYRNSTESPQLWKSEDAGKTWTKVNVGSKAQGADGNSDMDLVIDENGIIYFLSMRYSTIPEDTTGFDWSSMKGEHVVIGVCRDNGLTWKWTYLSQNDFDDRPWIETASDGSVHVIWNDGKGVHYVSSNDQGSTWNERRVIYPKGGSSHLAAGPDGRIAVRVTPTSASGFVFDEGVDLIMLSTDFGKTWNEVQIPGERDWSSEFGKGTPRWVEPLSWDQKGNLYYLWSEGKQLNLGISENDGKNWTIHSITSSDKLIYFPYLNASDNEITCTWASGFREDLTHHAAVVTVKDSGVQISLLEPQTLEDIRSQFSGSDNLAVGGEYFPMKVLSGGGYGMVTTIQNEPGKRLGFTWWKLSKVE